jgi:hypothetical protein
MQKDFISGRPAGWFFATDWNMSVNRGERGGVNDIILEEIRQAINALEFGIITVKVHGGKVIQVEVTEKKRFDDLWKLEGGGGI